MSLDTLKTKVGLLIEKAQSGGGEDTLGACINKTLEHWKNNEVTTLPFTNYFANLTSLLSVDLPSLTAMRDNTFEGCTNLSNVNLPEVTYVGAESFKRCTSVRSLKFPKATTVYTQSFYGATNLNIVDFGVTTDFARTNAFTGCSVLDTLILRGDTVSTLSSINNFDLAGAFAKGASGGTIYVPSALIESYKTATNWSVLYEAGRCNFVAIEGSEYE